MLMTFFYDGYVGWNNYAADSYYNGDIYPVINNATVNGVISTYYLDDGISTNTNANSLTIKTALFTADLFRVRDN